MKVTIESTRVVKPIYQDTNFPSTTESIPLSVFDKIALNSHLAVIYVYRAPTPTNSTIEHGLQRVLSEYREWAGRLVENEKGDPIVVLNDKGVKFVEARVEKKLDEFMPLKPSKLLFGLHPSLVDVDELLQVQLTRFACGSLILGFTTHHFVADGHSTSNFMIAWSKACRGLDMSPLPFPDRTIFKSRNPPKFEFEHRGVEFESKKIIIDCPNDVNSGNDVIVNKVHFTLEFLNRLKASASSKLNNNDKPCCYTTFECLAAHLWRAITKARKLDEFEKTNVQIGVNGRMRMNPKVPNEYFGNLVLWAFPTSGVKELIEMQLPYATKLVHDSISRMNDNYFKSFIDFAMSNKVEEEGLVPIEENVVFALSPNVELDSWIPLPFYEVDFGGGSPCMFMPSYMPLEGVVYLLPSFTRDGSIDAFVSLYSEISATFNEICYSLDD